MYTIQSNWIDFEIHNISLDFIQKWTQEEFETIVGEKVEAIAVNEDGRPIYVWTDNWVFTITDKQILMNQSPFLCSPRTPSALEKQKN